MKIPRWWFKKLLWIKFWCFQRSHVVCNPIMLFSWRFIWNWQKQTTLLIQLLAAPVFVSQLSCFMMEFSGKLLLHLLPQPQTRIELLLEQLYWEPKLHVFYQHRLYSGILTSSIIFGIQWQMKSNIPAFRKKKLKRKLNVNLSNKKNSQILFWNGVLFIIPFLCTVNLWKYKHIRIKIKPLPIYCWSGETAYTHIHTHALKLWKRKVAMEGVSFL